ncbi:MAG: hypothetical protein IJB86_09055 [Clostridia bacterium]|nr:hypothetical protein [Clostridia bacterium]
MKVELFAIVKDKATAPVLPQQMIHEAFSEIGSQTEKFKVYDNPRAFFGEMSKAFSRSRVIVAVADKESFLEQKWTLLKALGIKSEICSAIVSQIKNNVKATDPSLKAHALMPKDATVFMSSDGLYSGFAVKSGKQTLCYLPLDEKITAKMLYDGVRQYFADETKTAVNAAVKAVAPQKRTIPDNDERFVHTATTLSEKDLSVAIATTQTSVFIQNGVRNHPHYGDSFIFTDADDINDGDASVQERIVRLAENSRSEIGTELGAVVSNIYASETDSDELFIFVALADKERALVRKIVGFPGESANDLVHAATDEMYSMVLSYADGTLVPDVDTEMIPVKLYEYTDISSEAVAKQKKSVALKITICVVIALIISLLIGLFFKDEVAALFDLSEETVETTEAQTTLNEFTFVDITTEEATEESSTEVTVSAQYANLFSGSNNDSYHEIPAPTKAEPVYTTAPEKETTTKQEETTTQAATTVPVTETTTAETTTEATTTEPTTAETTTEITTTEPSTAETTAATTTVKETTTKSETEKNSETAVKGVFTFTTYGYGHGVGMSQLGARTYGDSQGRFNWKYDKILSHYYTGTTIRRETPPLTVKRYSKSVETKDFMYRVVQQEIGRGTASTKEALKAQAVAAYTFLKDKNYSINGDMAYYDNDNNISSYVKEAVDAVYGEYLCYTSSGKTAFTPFYSSSAGKTASAKDTWGGSNYPTLARGIESPETVVVDECKITAAEFKRIVDYYNKGKDSSNQITLSGASYEWIEILEHDGARGDFGYVVKIRVGDKTMSGDDFRTMIGNATKTKAGKIISKGLKSHCFTFTVG